MDAYVLYAIAGIVMLPAIIFAVYAQIKVHTTFNKYEKIPNSRGVTAAYVAEDLLRQNHCDVRIERVGGQLSDHYDPKRKVVALSDSVHSSTSIAALGIAAHEVGHAIQDEQGYAPLKIRNAIIRSTAVINNFLMPLVFIGLILQAMVFMSEAVLIWIILGAVIVYGISFVISLITLPTEFNASSRAKSMLIEAGLSDEERRGASRVLSAAAMTYVAGMVISLVYFVRFAAYLMILTDRR